MPVAVPRDFFLGGYTLPKPGALKLNAKPRPPAMSVTMSQNFTRKRYGLFILAILLLLLGGVGIYLGAHNYPIRALGLAAIMASAYLVRISHVHDRPDLLKSNGRGKDLKTTKGPGRRLWIVSLALVPLLVAALFLMYIDAVNGGNETWPVDVFAGVAVVCTIVWSYLAAKIYGSQ